MNERDDCGIFPTPHVSSIHDREIVLNLGFVYLLTRTDHAARLVVSLFSLRQWYDGPVTVFATSGEAHDIGRHLREEPRLGNICVQPLDEFQASGTEVIPPPNANYLTKVLALEQSPYDATVFLDADTLVAGDLEPLLNSALESPLTVTEFANWKSTDAHYQKHYESWELRANADGDTFQLERRLAHLMTIATPVINTGVVAVHQDSPILPQWKALARFGASCHIPDEMSLQLLLPDYEHNRLCTEFNCSPRFMPTASKAAIWHFANSTHLRHEASESIWLPMYRECTRLNIAQLATWSRVE